MSNRQLEQLRETLDSIVENLCSREQAIDEEQAHLLQRLNELDDRQTQLESLEHMAARMTAGLQTALTSHWNTLSADLYSHIQRGVAEALGQYPSTTRNAIAIGDGSPAGGDALAAPSAAAIDSWRQELASRDARIEQLAAQLDASRSQLAETEALLAEAIDQPSTAVATGSSEAELIDALRAEIDQLRQLLTAKEHDSVLVEELREEMARLRQATGQELGPRQAIEDGLRERLEQATCEIIDLRSQNEELAERVTKLQINVSTAPHGPMPHLGQEGLSWEERKRLLLQQLNAEMEDDHSSEAASKRIEIHDVLKSSDAEIARRDREIAELRSLLQQQADAREGMAVGAAAVAQLIESDELVQEEREKLRSMQRAWDEKCRQAEIELSMERAKLARERLQLEEHKQELEAALQVAQCNASGDGKDKNADRGRKWLSRLGLKDEK